MLSSIAPSSHGTFNDLFARFPPVPHRTTSRRRTLCLTSSTTFVIFFLFSSARQIAPPINKSNFVLFIHTPPFPVLVGSTELSKKSPPPPPLNKEAQPWMFSADTNRRAIVGLGNPGGLC
eukprot:GHVS01010245.1.p3 GENE.GHVS01010245.1~~GHVS01010245.1.p3  ORF type:complete len:120 (+),score=24.95 GHVS01010245.1:1954-2313(+)